MLNVPSEVVEEVIANVEDWAMTDTTEVTREEVERAVSKLKNGKAVGTDEVVAELVKNGGQAMVNWLWELLREVWADQASSSRVEERHLLSLIISNLSLLVLTGCSLSTQMVRLA